MTLYAEPLMARQMHVCEVARPTEHYFRSAHFVDFHHLEPGSRENLDWGSTWSLVGLLVQVTVVHAVSCHFSYDSPRLGVTAECLSGIRFSDEAAVPRIGSREGPTSCGGSYTMLYESECLSASLTSAALQAYGVRYNRDGEHRG